MQLVGLSLDAPASATTARVSLFVVAACSMARVVCVWIIGLLFRLRFLGLRHNYILLNEIVHYGRKGLKE